MLSNFKQSGIISLRRSSLSKNSLCRNLLCKKRACALAVGGVIGGAMMLGAGGPVFGATPIMVKLAPHRAVYEISLDRGSAGIARLSGRMVYEVRGDSCKGYKQNMRFVTRAITPEGVTSVSDMRAKSWEQAKGLSFSFSSSQYQDDKLLEQVAGDAVRNKQTGQIKVKIKQPKKNRLKLPAKAYFPIQHSIALLRAARQGKPLLSVDIFDGTDKGEKIYATTSIIGARLAAAAEAKLPTVKNAESLANMGVWPISISYFEKNNKKIDAVPVYELAFRFYENGVSRKLYIDYGSFAVRGVLSKLTYFKAGKCAG